jgi:hypothetical protein
MAKDIVPRFADPSGELFNLPGPGQYFRPPECTSTPVDMAKDVVPRFADPPGDLINRPGPGQYSRPPERISTPVDMAKGNTPRLSDPPADLVNRPGPGQYSLPTKPPGNAFDPKGPTSSMSPGMRGYGIEYEFPESRFSQERKEFPGPGVEPTNQHH